MVELRKRKAPAEAAPAPPTKKNVGKAAGSKPKDSSADKKTTAANGSSAKTVIAVGNTITLDGFGGEIETNDGEKTTLKKLVEESKGGVVIFTYPKASTPGCKRRDLCPTIYTFTIIIVARAKITSIRHS